MGVSKTGKTPASYYKSDVSVSQTTNTGFDSTTRKLCSGDGADSAASLSDDVLSVQPVNDDTTGTFLVKNNAGNNILAVDTTNSKVLGGASQTALNTQYAHFGVSYSDAFAAASFAADTHYAIPFNYANFGGAAAGLAMGSSTSSSFNDTNPATSLTISSTAMDIITTYWYVMDNITIDAVKWLHAADAATGDTTAAHLMTYAIDKGGGITGGDLSSGVVVADGANRSNFGYEQIYYEAMTVQSADVDAGRVIMFTFASDTINSDYSINATVKYHIR